MHTLVALFSLIFMVCSGAPVHRISTSDIPGINSPLPIDPVVEVPDDRFLFDLYLLRFLHRLFRSARALTCVPLGTAASWTEITTRAALQSTWLLCVRAAGSSCTPQSSIRRNSWVIPL
jgi:hypothetical protein